MTTEMSAGVRIILERIENFPGDFTPNTLNNSTSWASLANMVVREKDTFSEEERKAVRDALRNGRRREFDAKIMDKLNEKPRVKMSSGPLTVNKLQSQVMNDLVKQFEIAYGSAPIKKEGGSV